MLAFSTNWNSHRYEKGGPMLQEIEALGFQGVELGHGIKASAVAGILKYLAKTNLKICSLHNYCPLPSGLEKSSPDFVEFTAVSVADRKRAVQKTAETIDFANQVGASVVVLHLGSCPYLKQDEKLLVKALENGMRREVIDRKLKIVRLWDCSKNDFEKRMEESLLDVMAYAQMKGIKLGIENRAFFSQLPNNNWEAIWKLDQNKILGYWHDFGHAQVQEHLGWSNHWESFTQKKDRLIGCHFHDTKFLNQDHQALGSGRVPWDLLLPKVPSNIPWVMEYHPLISSETIKKDKAWLETRLRP